MALYIFLASVQLMKISCLASLQILQAVQACLTYIRPNRGQEACLGLADLLQFPDNAEPGRCLPTNKVCWMASVLHQFQMAQGIHALLASLQAALPQWPQGQVRHHAALQYFTDECYMWPRLHLSSTSASHLVYVDIMG